MIVVFICGFVSEDTKNRMDQVVFQQDSKHTDCFVRTFVEIKRHLLLSSLVKAEQWIDIGGKTVCLDIKLQGINLIQEGYCMDMDTDKDVYE